MRKARVWVQLLLRLTGEQSAWVENAARMRGTSQTQVIRDLIMQAMKEPE